MSSGNDANGALVRIQAARAISDILTTEEIMLARFKKQIATFGAALMLGTLVGCAGTGEKVGTALDDTAITTKVKSALAADREVSATSVHVKTINGTVNLTGEVKSREEKRKAEEIARKVTGVQSVSNGLTVGN